MDAIRGVIRPWLDRAMPMMFMARAKVMFCLIMVMVVFPIFSSLGRFDRSSVTSTMSAVSMAISVPDSPMAMPMSAWANAGASLIPSPIMATVEPWFLRVCILCALSAGISSAMALSMAHSEAMLFVTCLLSPVSIMICFMPFSFLSCVRVCFAFSRG